MCFFRTFFAVLFLALVLVTNLSHAEFVATPKPVSYTLHDGTRVIERFSPIKSTLAPVSKTIEIKHGHITIRYRLTTKDSTNWDLSDEDNITFSEFTISNKKRSIHVPQKLYPNCHFNNYADEIIWINDAYLALPDRCVGNYISAQNTRAVFSIFGKEICFLGNVAEIIDGRFEAFDSIYNPYGDTLHGWGLRIQLSEQKGKLLPDVKRSELDLRTQLLNWEKFFSAEFSKLKTIAPASRPNCGKEPCRPSGGYAQDDPPQGNCDPVYEDYCSSLWNFLDSAFRLAAIANYIKDDDTKTRILNQLEESNFVDEANLEQFKYYLAKAKPTIRPF